ncbi:MAG: hypothetical protein ACRCX2_21985 [Paraclostridium sp.]
MDKRSDKFLSNLIKSKKVTLDRGFTGSRQVPFLDFDREIRMVCGESVDAVSIDTIDTGIDQNETTASLLKDAPNLTKMGMESMDKWTNVFNTLYSSNSNNIEVTGNFKKNPLYKTFVIPAMETLTTLFDEKGSDVENPYIAYLQKMHDLLCEQTTMKCVSGGTKAPFLYEGFQIVFLEALHQTIMASFVAISKDIDLETVYEETKNKVFKTYFIMLEDICSEQNMVMYKQFGKEIIYNIPVNKDIDTGSVAESPYFKYKDIVALAKGENLTNVTSIKNAGMLDIILVMLDAMILTTESLGGQSLDVRYKFFDTMRAYMDETDSTARGMKENELRTKYNNIVTTDAEIRANLEKEQDKQTVKVVF